MPKLSTVLESIIMNHQVVVFKPGLDDHGIEIQVRSADLMTISAQVVHTNVKDLDNYLAETVVQLSRSIRGIRN